MKTAREHPDTAEVVADVILARIAATFLALAILLPALLAVLQ